MRDSVARGVGRGSLSPGCEISGLARNDDEPGQSNAYAIFALRISQRCETNEWVERRDGNDANVAKYRAKLVCLSVRWGGRPEFDPCIFVARIDVEQGENILSFLIIRLAGKE